jgi:hypothetical protein
VYTIPTVDAFHNSLQPQQSFVAVFDVLGFKERVAHSNLDALVREYRHFVNTQTWATTIPVATPAGVHQWRVADAIFSDTILLWCDDNWDSVQTLITASACLIASALDLSWPIRGGLAYGNCVLDRVSRTFIGQPIIDAHITEQNQKWIGAALHSSIIQHPTLGRNIIRLEDVVKYPVPTKLFSKKLEYAIHWCPYSTHAQSIINRLSNQTNKLKVKRKYYATKTYLKSTCQGYAAMDVDG